MARIAQTETFALWLHALRDVRAKAVIVERIQRLGRGLPGDVKSVHGGVSELRIHYGPGYRIYFTRRGNELVILLCGGTKSAQDSDISKAHSMAAAL